MTLSANWWQSCAARVLTTSAASSPTTSKRSTASSRNESFNNSGRMECWKPSEFLPQDFLPGLRILPNYIDSFVFSDGPTMNSASDIECSIQKERRCGVTTRSISLKTPARSGLRLENILNRGIMNEGVTVFGSLISRKIEFRRWTLVILYLLCKKFQPRFHTTFPLSVPTHSFSPRFLFKF